MPPDAPLAPPPRVSSGWDQVLDPSALQVSASALFTAAELVAAIEPVLEAVALASSPEPMSSEIGCRFPPRRSVPSSRCRSTPRGGLTCGVTSACGRPRRRRWQGSFAGRGGQLLVQTACHTRADGLCCRTRPRLKCGGVGRVCQSDAQTYWGYYGSCLLLHGDCVSVGLAGMR